MQFSSLLNRKWPWWLFSKGIAFEFGESPSISRLAFAPCTTNSCQRLLCLSLLFFAQCYMDTWLGSSFPNVNCLQLVCIEHSWDGFHLAVLFHELRRQHFVHLLTTPFSSLSIWLWLIFLSLWIKTVLSFVALSHKMWNSRFQSSITIICFLATPASAFL